MATSTKRATPPPARSLWAALLTALCLLLVACGTLTVGIDTTPTLPPVPLATPTALAGDEAALVYGDGRAVYLLHLASEEAHQLMELPDTAGHFALSPLGYLAYVLDDTLYLADLAGGGVRPVYSAAGRSGADSEPALF